MMAKDTGLALEEGLAHGVPLPLGALVQQLFRVYCASGMGEDDFSGIIRMLRPRAES
jgi:3-hydroxyisobutyrate dehydrogenase